MTFYVFFELPHTFSRTLVECQLAHTVAGKSHK